MIRHTTWIALLLVGCSAGAEGSSDEPGDPPGSGGATTTPTTGSGGGNVQTGSGGSSMQGGTGGGSAQGGAAGRGGSSAMGGGGGSGPVIVGDGGKGAPTLKCSTQINSNRPATAPALEPGVWKNITPPGIPLGNAEDVIGQGIAIDPCNLSTVYWGTTPFTSSKGAVWKSTDGGGTWKKAGQIDEPLHVRVDPTNPKHLYAGDGVRGGTLGFWVSNDGGDTWSKPAGWVAIGKTVGFVDDLYDVAVDPTDFKHVLVSSHSAWGWDDTKWNKNAGILESKDGGDTWIVHDPQMTWGAGHSINFLYDPDKGIGDANTWLIGTQGDGQWRTTDAGKTWTKVMTSSIFHGGGEVYYAKDGKVYSTGTQPCLQRSTDNGATWQPLKAVGQCTGVWGDGNYLYTAPAYAQGMHPMYTSPETDGLTWTPYKGGAQKFNDSGPYEMAFDSVNGILYASMWFQGVWALKVTP